MSDLALDLRSDAITLPTEEMWEAMRSARLGWAHAGEDPNVSELEAEAAALAGKQSALLLQSGSLGNLLALMTHARRGDQVILDGASHIAWSEEWGIAHVCGLFPRLVESVDGRMNPDRVRDAIDRAWLGHLPQTSLVCLESSHNFSGGVALGAAYLGAIAAIAQQHGARTHLDAARIFNSTAALNEDPHVVMAPFDSAVFNLNKSLSAPGGAVLVGSEDFIGGARINLRRVGGSPGHQAGILAAAGLVALRTMIPQAAVDNRRARELASRLDAVDGASVDVALVQMNIVRLHVDDAQRVAAELERRGLRTMVLAMDELRLVTHRHVTDDSPARAAAILEEAIASSRNAGLTGDL
ncbi:MAG: DegT/DnrJ/EryC1/StrS family aminotransferase [Actinobacteria bacterium]|nr:DegT/DnrJ/EryC1/StrS family aminotransferase [Actinomycetota bacterium]